MKIEIGESLVRTWVRHCRECQLAELNWKPSPVWSGDITEEHKRWYDDAKAVFSSKVLKRTSSILQFLGQAEVDVLGVSFVQGKVDKVIAADIAFHANGLQYGSKAETAARITKKLFRTSLILDVYFPGILAEIAFLSPKVNPATIPGVLDAEQVMQSFFAERRSTLTFRIIINEGFKEIVLDKVFPLQKKVADTSELFLRATQLVGLFGSHPAAGNVTLNGVGIRRQSTGQTLPIELIPANRNEFKRLLLLKRGAIKYECYRDGHIEQRPWLATRVTESSDIIRNLRSSSGYRQGEWQARDMLKLVVKINGFED